MTIEEEKKAAAEKEAKRKETLERGTAILSQPDNFKNIVSGAVLSLQKTSEEKGKFGASDKLSAEDRFKRQKQDSENRRVVREAKRSQATGRTSNWLKRYAERKASESNTQNAVLQQTIQPSSSISYSPTSSSQTQGSARSSRDSQPPQPQQPSSGLPEGATAKLFDVCENGQPKQYWFVVWDQKPTFQ